jgi:hypothetical protein
MAFWGNLHGLRIKKVSAWIWMTHKVCIHHPHSQQATSSCWCTAFEAVVCLSRVQGHSYVEDFSVHFQTTSNKQIHHLSFQWATSHGCQAAFEA